MNIEEIRSLLLNSPAANHWKKIGVRRRAGVLFPLFSLCTKKNMGIGEFPDLKMVVDWCVLTGNTIIQLLPINDTGSQNYPYSSLSAFALNPVFLSLWEMDGLEGDKSINIKILEFSKKGKQRRRINYATILNRKMRLFELLFKEFDRNTDFRLKDEFRRYREQNRAWLDDYCLYKAMKEKFGDTSWEQWPKKYRDRDKAAMNSFRDNHNSRIRFYSYLQWQTEKQFTDLHQYASKRGILIKGDIPFLVGRDSADVWAHKRFFNVQTSAGASPDMFSITGQKWGFPTFNWETMSNEGYDWYIRRLKQAEKFYDLYRIDHAIGLYRIYSIDINRTDGSIGWFDPPDESIWEEHGEKLLRMMLRASHMLPIAEDLGVVPECVRPNLKKLGIPRTVVDRWERNYSTDSSYSDLSDMDAIAMNTLSTHDTETFRQWWRDSIDDRNEFYKTLCFNRPPPKRLTPEIHQRILERSYNSSCMFSINLPQDIFRLRQFTGKPERHRINTPSTVSPMNWSYVFPIMLEELIDPASRQVDEENKRIQRLIEKSRR